MGKQLWVERNKDGSWDAFSDDGAHIKFGHGRGIFSPGDLMKVALAACAAMSCDYAVKNTLGENRDPKIVVDGTFDEATNAYTAFHEQIAVDATGTNLDDDQAETLKKRIEAYIHKGCTVMHTYEQDTPVTMDIDIER